MGCFLVCHGAWSGGWSWKKMRPLLRAAGHEVFTPTYTGLGERAHLAHPLVDLETHIQDVLAVIEAEDLHDIHLVAHSYGGMVGTGVADRMPARIRHLIYLDAFVPADGQSLQDQVGGGAPRNAVDGWLIPPNPAPSTTPPEDLAWAVPRQRHQPARCFTQPLRVADPAPPFARSYIHCTRKDGHDPFRPIADRLRHAPGWGSYTMDASHSPNITAPEALATLLLQLAAA
jgi:pimeloyl-ACP methyl ester carboxylesterase